MHYTYGKHATQWTVFGLPCAREATQDNRLDGSGSTADQKARGSNPFRRASESAHCMGGSAPDPSWLIRLVREVVLVTDPKRALSAASVTLSGNPALPDPPGGARGTETGVEPPVQAPTQPQQRPDRQSGRRRAPCSDQVGPGQVRFEVQTVSWCVPVPPGTSSVSAFGRPVSA